MTWANAKIKRILVRQNWQEKQVRPAPLYEYEYTFKWKTVSQIQNEFTLQSWSLNVNSDWFTWSSSQDCLLIKSIPSLSTAKKIIITWTMVVNSLMVSNNASFFWIWSSSGYVINRVEWSTYSWINVAVKTNGTVVNGNAVWNTVQWTYTQTLTIDLENKQVIGAVPWFSNSTLTLTDAQITAIRSFGYLETYVSLNLSAISNVSIKVY
jgi:hypothetical protein